jgi:hypothetical protein
MSILGASLLGDLVLGGVGGASVSSAALGAVSQGDTSGSQTSLTFSATVATGEALLVLVMHWDLAGVYSDRVIDTVTFNGDALTQIGTGGQSGIQFTAFEIDAPDVGTFDVVITPNATTWISAAAVPLSNYGGSIIDTDSGSGVNPTASVFSDYGELVLGQLGWWNGTTATATGTGQTEIYAESEVGTDVKTALSSAAGAPTVTMSWTGPGSQWVIGWVRVLGAVPEEADTPPNGGGEVPDSVNPEAGDLPTDFPLKFVQIQIAGTDYYFAETQLNDNDTWTEAPGKKAGKLANISTVRRELSTRGNYVTSRCSVTLADTDRQFRILASSGALAGSYVALWVVDDATRRAEGAPFRYWAGEVVSHRAEPGFRYTLELEDVLGRRLSEYSKQPQLPPDKFSTAWFPAINPGMDGKAIPIVCGFVSDQDDTTPQGVAPATFAGYFLDSDLGVVVDAYIWSQGAFSENGIWQVFYNDPATPDIRSIVPDDAWGVAVWAPGKPGWDDTSFTTPYYADYLGRRYMPLLVLRSHPLAEAAREGRVLIAGNLYGVSQSATGGGVQYLDDPARLWQWLLTNYVFNRYTDENTYFDLPTLDGTYSVIDTDTVAAVEAVHNARIAGGYRAGFILGAGGEAESVFDVQQRLLEHLDFDCGINRHGQLIVSAEDTTAAATETFTAQADIEDGTYEMRTDTEGRINRVEWKYGFRYIPPVAPPATAAEGEPVPTQLPPYSDWRSGLQITEDTTAQTTVGSIDTYELEMSMVQDAGTAANVAATVLARGLGPQDDGPRMVRFTVPAWRTWVELGDVVNVYHPERVGSSSTGVDKVRILAIEVDPMRDRRTLEGRVIG